MSAGSLAAQRGRRLGPERGARAPGHLGLPGHGRPRVGSPGAGTARPSTSRGRPRGGASGPASSSDRSQTRGRASKTGFVHAMSSNAADQEPVFPKNTPASQLPSGLWVCPKITALAPCALATDRAAWFTPCQTASSVGFGTAHSYATRSVGASNAAAASPPGIQHRHASAARIPIAASPRRSSQSSRATRPRQSSAGRANSRACLTTAGKGAPVSRAAAARSARRSARRLGSRRRTSSIIVRSAPTPKANTRERPENR